jgi:hypothetical protein
MPQPPQFRGLFVVFTQRAAVPHDSVPVGQPHVPPVHVLPPVQVMPQPPQFALSVFVFTQAPAQAVSPAAQVVPQTLREQTSFVPQAVLQPPQ